MIRPEQMRMARAGLGWTLNDLATKASVNPNTIARFEAGRDIMAGTLRKLESALHEAGVALIQDANCYGVTVPRQG